MNSTTAYLLNKEFQSIRVAVVLELLNSLMEKVCLFSKDFEFKPGLVEMVDQLMDFLKKVGKYLRGMFCAGEQIYSDGQLRVASCFLTLVDTFCWLFPDNDGVGLRILIEDSSFLQFITEFTLPSSLILQSAMVLRSISAHTVLASILYESIQKVWIISSEKSILIHLCTQLAKPVYTPKIEELIKKEFVISFFLSLLPNNLQPELVEHQSILSGMIISLNTLVAILWEEDTIVMDSSTVAEKVVKTLYEGVLFLHGILCTEGRSTASMQLNQVLYGLPKSSLEVWNPSLAHYYVLSIGRLSYAPVPHWLNSQCKEIIEASCDLAHDLLGVVIEGPEEDLIWSAFNENEEQPSAMDVVNDDELEIQRMDI